jgi:serine/threonine protein kinase
VLEPGALIAGKYKVVSKLGEGGMGVVYDVLHTRLRQRFAVKMLLPSLAAQPELVERFEREARAAATIDSPNVAKVVDVDATPEGVPYMVIELLEGHDLGVELADRLQLPIPEAVGYVMSACAPIAQAHAMGIVHRDLKPSNLFLAQKGRDRVLKVLDFGIAKVFSEKNAKVTSSMFGLGTPHYMSPEQVRRSSNVDQRADIWSLGVILYELLTGTVPFPEEPSAAIAAIAADPILPPRDLRRDIPEDLERVIMRALEKDREKRFGTARDLALALAPFAPEEELAVVSANETLPARTSIPDIETLAPPPSAATPIPRIPRAPKTPGPTTSGAIALAPVVPDRTPRASSARVLLLGACACVALGAVVAWRLMAAPSTSRPPAVAAQTTMGTASAQPPTTIMQAVVQQPTASEAIPTAPKPTTTATTTVIRSTAASAAAPPTHTAIATSNPVTL